MVSVFDVIKIGLVLITMRMYDDIMHGGDDSLNQLKLPIAVFLGLIVLTWLGSGTAVAISWIYFFALNHILYKALSHRPFWSFILPLIPYLAISVAISMGYFPNLQIDVKLVCSLITVFLSAFIFEWLNGTSERKPAIFIYIFSIGAVAMIVFNDLNIVSFIVGVLGLLISLLLLIFNPRHVQFWWMLTILLIRVITMNFGE